MKKSFIYLFATLSLFQCKNGDPGLVSLVNTIAELPGVNCLGGGIKVQTGIDANSNHILDPNEVQNEQYVCNGFYDNVILLTIRATPGIGITTTSGTNYVGGSLPNFNEKNYTKIDSISFVVSASADQNTNRGTVELFNLTDNIPIPGSLVNINSTIIKNYVSSNIVKNFPTKDVNLGFRVTGTSGTINVWNGIYLVLYRKQ